MIFYFCCFYKGMINKKDAQKNQVKIKKGIFYEYD